MGDRQKFHSVNWNVICNLGIRKMLIFNQALWEMVVEVFAREGLSLEEDN
jgi:hypothetical protein